MWICRGRVGTSLSVRPALRAACAAARAGPATRGCAGSAGTRAQLLRNRLVTLPRARDVPPQVEEGAGSPSPSSSKRRASRRRPGAARSGRSRGSWTDSAAVITSTSRRQPVRSASTSMRPSRGRRAAWTERARRGQRVRRPCSSAPSSSRRARPSPTAAGVGACRRTGNAARSPRSRADHLEDHPTRDWCAGSPAR
jgi:hypothetical protein